MVRGGDDVSQIGQPETDFATDVVAELLSPLQCHNILETCF